MKKFIKEIHNKIIKPAGYWLKSFWGRYKFQTILTGIIIIASYIFIKYITKQNDTYSFYDELDYKGNPFYIVNIAIVLAAIGTAIFTWWKNIINQKLSETQENIRLDELYAKAVEYLKSTNDLITRKGGVHILKDLAMTSPKHAQKCIDMLCSLNETWMPKFLKIYPYFFELNKNFPNIKNIEEIKWNKTDDEKDLEQYVYYNNNTRIYINDISLSQLVLISLSEIIKHISEKYEYKGPYDLSYKYLCSINLEKVDFKKFRLELTNLQSANLAKSNMHSIFLENVEFQNINLSNANLKNIVLVTSNLHKANLENADFSFATLFGTKFEYGNIINTNFSSADLFYAVFRSCNIIKTNFENADLQDADFRNAFFKDTNFLNAKNVDKAFFDENTKM